VSFCCLQHTRTGQVATDAYRHSLGYFQTLQSLYDTDQHLLAAVPPDALSRGFTMSALCLTLTSTSTRMADHLVGAVSIQCKSQPYVYSPDKHVRTHNTVNQ
jgi:hypothetical protein